MVENLVEKFLASTKIYKGKIFSLRTDTVTLPSGRKTERDIIEHPGAVAIIPLLEDQLILIRQFRQAAGKILCELPAGTLKEKEDPRQCAIRELEEETGFVAGSITRLFCAYPTPGYSTELIHYFLATNLKRSRQKTDPDESIEVLTINKNHAFQMVLSNEIEDAKTICGLLFLKHLDAKPLL